MLPFALLALIVNSVVLILLARYRQGEVHLPASWIFTRADVIANMAVIVAAVPVKVTHSRLPDILIGFAIGAYVIREAIEIRTMAASRRPITEIGGR